MSLEHSIIKENDQDLLSDTHIESYCHQLLNEYHLLEEENRSLQFAKQISIKEAHKMANQKLYHQLITQNQTNMELRIIYKQMMKDKQLKKQNFYKQGDFYRMNEGVSLRNSGTFSLASSSKGQSWMTPSHTHRKSIASQYYPQRKSFCPTRNQGFSGFSSRQSFDNTQIRPKRKQATVQSQNIFLNMFALIVEEQKQTQFQQYKQINKYNMFKDNIGSDKQMHLTEVQMQIEQTSIKVQKMIELMRLYQQKLGKSRKQCDQLQNIIQNFSTAKNKLFLIQQKIDNITHLKQQITDKQQYLSNKDGNKKSVLQNFDMLLKMFQCDQGSSIQGIQKLNPRQAKIKQLIQSIRNGRDKFKQIYNIYKGRIQVLEGKLKQMKQ